MDENDILIPDEELPEFTLEDILREFGSGSEDDTIHDAVTPELLEDLPVQELLEDAPVAEHLTAEAEPELLTWTPRPKVAPAADLSDTQSFAPVTTASAGDTQRIDTEKIRSQALMELGATVCVPNGEPKCGACPCRDFCEGRDQWQKFPVKLPKKAKKQEDRTVFLLHCGENWAIEKRPNKGLLAGLWQFPNVAGHLTAEEAVRWAEEKGLHPRHVERSMDRHHIFTHIRWDLRGWFLEVEEMAGGFTWLTLDEIDEQAALPTAFRQFREEI